MYTQLSQSWDLLKHSKRQGLHTHTEIYEFLNIAGARLTAVKIPKTKTLLVFQIKDTKSDSGQSCSGKQLADWRKREREQFQTGKPKS